MPGLQTQPAQWPFSNLLGGLFGTTAATQMPTGGYFPTAVTSLENVYTYYYQQHYVTIQQQYFNNVVSFGFPVDPEELRQAKQKRIAASDRAEQLLLTFLREEHQKSYKEHGHFDVEVKGRIYRIHKGRSMNVTLLDKKGVKICRYCAHPSEYVPDADTMLAQYLMLTTDEKKFLGIANKHRLAA